MTISEFKKLSHPAAVTAIKGNQSIWNEIAALPYRERQSIINLLLGVKHKAPNKKDQEYPILSLCQLDRRQKLESPFGDGIEWIGMDGKIYDIEEQHVSYY